MNKTIVKYSLISSKTKGEIQYYIVHPANIKSRVIHRKCLVHTSIDIVFITVFGIEQKFQPGISYQRKLREHHMYCNQS